MQCSPTRLHISVGMSLVNAALGPPTPNEWRNDKDRSHPWLLSQAHARSAHNVRMLSTSCPAVAERGAASCEVELTRPSGPGPDESPGPCTSTQPETTPCTPARPRKRSLSSPSQAAGRSRQPSRKGPTVPSGRCGAGLASTSPFFPPTRTDTQPRSLPPCGDASMRTPMGLILCSSWEPKPLLLHLTKRSHGCQRVHIVPPLHDLPALDGHDRDEPVVV